MKEIAAEGAQLKVELADASAEATVVALHTGALARFQRALENLQALLAAGAASGDHAGTKALRELIASVTVARDDSRPGGISLVITGRLAVILGEDAPFPAGVSAKMVAGAGIEPATYGL
jgi:hypothetical protein